MFRAPVLLLSLSLATNACQSATEPNHRDVAGNYSAVSLTLGVYDFSHDVYGLGASLDISLHPDGSLDRHLFLPAPWAPFSNDTSEYDLVFEGTWRCCDPILTLHTTQPSFFDNAEVLVRHDTWS